MKCNQVTILALLVYSHPHNFNSWIPALHARRYIVFTNIQTALKLGDDSAEITSCLIISKTGGVTGNIMVSILYTAVVWNIFRSDKYVAS
jgi:hypothetical protein